MSRRIELTLHVHRYDPEQERSWVQTYTPEVGEMMRFTDVLRKINEEIDATLAWTSSCEHAQCGSCAVVVPLSRFADRFVASTRSTTSGMSPSLNSS